MYAYDINNKISVSHISFGPTAAEAAMEATAVVAMLMVVTAAAAGMAAESWWWWRRQ